MQKLKFYPSFLTVENENKTLQPAPEVFVETDDPQKAQLFLFPFDIGPAIDFNLADEMEQVLASLPYLPERAEHHLVTDMADRAESVSLKVCLFKVSVTEDSGLEERVVVTGYRTPPYVLCQKPVWSLKPRYDCSFIGANSHFSREAAILSIRQEAPELRFFAQLHDSFVVQGNSFFIKECSKEELERRQSVFVRSLHDSICILCPPGVGPQSVRLYETMCMGRLPVLFDYKTLYPFPDKIDYSAFALIIPAEKLMHTGALLKEWLKRHSPEELSQKAVLARKVWWDYFSPAQYSRRLLEEAGRKFGF